MRNLEGMQAIAAGFMLAPAVAMLRLPLMTAESEALSPRHGETTRAVSEKLAASAEGLFAAQLSMIGALAGFWPELMSGKVPSVLNGVAVQQCMEAALRPASRKVKANFRRLSERR